MTSDSKKKLHWLKHNFKYALSFILSGIFLYIAFYGVDFEKVINYVSDASVFWVIVFIVVFYFSHYLRAIRWKVILSSVKPDTSIINLFGSLMVGYGVNCVLPRLGEVSRAVLIGKWEKLSRSSMFGTVIIERVIDIIFLGLSVIVAVIIWSESIYDKFPWLKAALYITFILLVVFFVAIFLMVRYKEKFFKIIVNVLNKFSPRLANKSAYIFDMLLKGFTSLKGTKNYIITILLSALIMAVYALNAYIGFFMIGMQHIHPVNYAMGWVLMSISAIGVVIPTPGATGSYHALTKAALVLLFGFGGSISFAYAFLTHIISYILFILSGLFFFFILNRQHDNLIKIVETEMEKL